ncbi:MAG TPA: aminotransferase class I/II-fold pyridoxal phosphate-dependent enzyme, partial [Planctomycetota bacterium]|nr:aminotransferase class I/II-fold pyridoxal phosphate-dependent enzyme [Planctomycetota bacterium]
MARPEVVPARRMDRLPPYLFGQINAAKTVKRRAGVDVIDLGMGNPTDPTPEPIVEKLREAVLDPRNHRYSVSIGVPNLRLEVARLYKRHWNVRLDPDKEVVACIGSKEGFSHLCLALLGSGDTCLVPTPAFPIHVHSAAMTGANVIRVPLAPNSRFLSKMDDLARHITPKPKLAVLNYPHNPTTRTVDLDFFRDVVRIARRHNILLIHDLAYGLTTFDGYKAPSILQVRGAKDLAVEFFTMSKGWNMAGWRVGFAVGNRQMLGALATVKGYYDYGMFQAVQIAAIIGMRTCDAFVAEQAKVYEARRDVLCRQLGRIGWRVRRPKASMFVWVPIPRPFRKMGSMKVA